MRIRHVLLFLLLTLPLLSSYAQTEEPITPKSGYWQSTMQDEVTCRDKDGINWGMLWQEGYQSVIPVTLSDDGNGLYIYDVALRRYQDGYHSELFPSRPDTFTSQFNTYAELIVHDEEHMSLNMGGLDQQRVESDGSICLHYTVYELDYMGNERPTPPPAPLQAGYWNLMLESHETNQEYCDLAYASTIYINGDGQPQYYHFIVGQNDAGEIRLDITNRGNREDHLIITPTSEDEFTGLFDINGCKFDLVGKFEGEFLTLSSYDDLGIDPSVILQSGLWNPYAGTNTTVLDGTCDAHDMIYLNEVIQVSEDGQWIDFITQFGISTLQRDEKGLYTGTYYNSAKKEIIYLAIEPLSPTSFNYYLENKQTHDGESCIVLQTGRGSWGGDLLPAIVEPFNEEDLPPALEVVPDCTISASAVVNLRSGAGTDFERAGTLQAGESEQATAKSEPVAGYVWYYLARGAWVREDVITASGDCADLPTRNS